MTRMTLNTRVGADGVLHVPLGANLNVQNELQIQDEP
jgi:hypothetical protein